LKNTPIELEIAEQLLKHKDMKFSTGYSNFLGKTLGEIADEINRDTHHGKRFVAEIIEKAVAHMIELNDEEK